MRYLSLCVTSFWCFFAYLKSWLYLLCWFFFLIVFVNFFNSSMLITRVASLWRFDRISMFLRSSRVRNALSETNWSLFSRCEAMLVEHYTTCVCLCVATCVSTWFSMLIVANAFHSCHCFIVILIPFWFWCVSTSSWRRFLILFRMTLTIYKHFLSRGLHLRCSKSFCVLIFIEASNLRRVNVSSHMLFECVLVVFDRYLISLIELSKMMFDCLNIFCKLCFYIRF